MSSKENCPRPAPEPEGVSWHLGFKESTNRAKEDKVCEEDKGWMGLRMQGQRVCVLVTMVKHCKLLRRQVITIEQDIKEFSLVKMCRGAGKRRDEG